MSQLMTIKLSKNPGASWGFRLQGGKDFATPLCLQKVNVGSVAASAGLQAGDAIVSIGNQDALGFRHKEAQDAIVRAGNSFDMVIQRGTQTWRPQVTALPEVKSTPEGPVATKTSLAANKKPIKYIGSNHNCVPKPFPGAGKLAYSPIKMPHSAISPSRQKFSTSNNTFPLQINHEIRNGANSVFSRNSDRYFDPGDPPLTIAETDVILNKENARAFLRMTLDKENFNTSNIPEREDNMKSDYRKYSLPFGMSKSNSSSYSNLSSVHGSYLSSMPGGRKLSLGSNCSSLNSVSSHEGDCDINSYRSIDDFRPAGTGHNTNAAPFGQVNGSQIVNSQYNSPLHIYSDDTIAETLSAQAEVLGKGVLGVNFMKNEKAFDGKQSDVLRMVQEMDSGPVRADSPGIVAPATFAVGSPERPAQGHSFKLLERALDDYESGGQDSEVPSVIRSVKAPETAPGMEGSAAGVKVHTTCSECERPIVGVFVRIKNKNLHADCFKCATCGSSLKNVGYYNVNEKLYCDIHAKQAARQNPPCPNVEPVTVSPGGMKPPGSMTSAQAKFGGPAKFSPTAGVSKVVAPSSPKFAPSGPAPFKPPAGGVHIMPSPLAAPFKPEPTLPKQEIQPPQFAPVSAIPEPIMRSPPPIQPQPVETMLPAEAILPESEPEEPTHLLQDVEDFQNVLSAEIESSFIAAQESGIVESDEIAFDSAKDDAQEKTEASVTDNLISEVCEEFEGVSPVDPSQRPMAAIMSPEPTLLPETEILSSPVPREMEIPSSPPVKSPLATSPLPPAVVPSPVPQVSPARGSPLPSAFSPIPQSSQPEEEKPVIPLNQYVMTASVEPTKLHDKQVANVVSMEGKQERSLKYEQHSNFLQQSQRLESHFESSHMSFSSGQNEFGRQPAAAPAPFSVQPPVVAPVFPIAPAAPVVASPAAQVPTFRPAPASNPQNFGAPADDINVRSHIPKKGAGTTTFAPAPVAAPKPGSSSSPASVMPSGGVGGILRGVAQTPGQRTAPRRGRGVMNQASASRIPVCSNCQRQIRGPFVSALGKTWCPDDFVCATGSCKRQLIDVGFVEEQGSLYCENCYERYLAPICGKCDKRIKGDCLNAIGKHFHPECFCCAYCGKVFGSGAFYLEDGLPYCETHWNDLFTTKCVGCNFPIEAGDRWVEALNNNYHSQCFKCSKCNKNLEGQSFFAKGGKPFCKTHASQRGF